MVKAYGQEIRVILIWTIAGEWMVEKAHWKIREIGG